MINNSSTLTKNNEPTTNQAHLHKILTISGKVDKVENIPDSKLGYIVFEKMLNEKFYFFKETLSNEELQIGENVTFGILDFFIGENFSEKAFEDKEGRGIIVFNITSAETLDKGMEQDSGPISLENYVAKPSQTSLMAGTKACAPCKFLNAEGRMVHYTLNKRNYYPMVTFADQDNPLGSCYLSFFKCKEEEANQIEDVGTPSYVFSVNDYPRIDEASGVLVHEDVY